MVPLVSWRAYIALVLVAGLSLACGTAQAQSESDLERHLREVMRLAKERHVDRPSQSKLYRGAIDGLLTVFSLNWQRRDTDDVLSPTRGSNVTAFADLAPAGVISDNSFVRVGAQGAHTDHLLGAGATWARDRRGR